MRFYIKMFLIWVIFLYIPGSGICEFITQGEWAKQLVKALGLEETGIPEKATIDDYISLLKGGESIHIPVEQIPGRNLIHNINVINSGVYTLFVQSGASALILRIGENVRFIQNGNGRSELIFGGKYILKRGVHQLTIIPQDSGAIGSVYLLAPCMPKVEPPGGWQPEKPLTFADKAVTIIKALNMEDRLPAEKSIKINITDQEHIEFSLPESGVYSFFIASSTPMESEWFIDNCFHASLINPNNSNGFIWKEVGTFPLFAGKHTITNRLKKGKINNSLLIVKRDTATINYMTLLKKLNPLEGELHKNVSVEVAAANLLNPVFALRKTKGPEAFFYIEENELPRMPSEKEKPPYTEPISPVLPSGL